MMAIPKLGHGVEDAEDQPDVSDNNGKDFWQKIPIRHVILAIILIIPTNAFVFDNTRLFHVNGDNETSSNNEEVTQVSKF
jgi:hypothetical protein